MDYLEYEPISFDNPTDRESVLPLELNDIEIMIRDGSDPYFEALYLTSQSLDFGYPANEYFVFGIIILVIGVGMIILPIKWFKSYLKYLKRIEKER